MKKVIMMFAAVAMAIGAQAATIKWTVTDSNNTPMGVYRIGYGESEAAALGAWNEIKAYFMDTLFTGYQWQQQLVRLQYDDTFKVKSFESSGGSFNLEENLWFGDNVNEYDYMTLLVTRDNENLTPGGAFDLYLVDKTRTLDLGTMTPHQSGNFGGGAAGNIPEPTSGLMLLLGMAGLALKRKVA